MNDKYEWFINKIIGHQHHNNSQLEFEVCWSLGDTIWEPASNCADLTALDQYLKLHGVLDTQFLRYIVVFLKEDNKDLIYKNF
ncbi:hypothetical protein AN958_10117 [Leucoagaricus sp. SymC.cos]|nr:hypothetical protein AN958_10117 [Leucoagaricus sp. SymC.cos]